LRNGLLCSARNDVQHSTKLTASPPKLVSLYFDCMSAPVWRIVAITLSSDTMCRPSPCKASEAAAIAFTPPKALRSMQGICTKPPTGSQVMPRWCSMAISAAFSICAFEPPRAAHKPAAAIEEATPTSPGSRPRRPLDGAAWLQPLQRLLQLQPHQPLIRHAASGGLGLVRIHDPLRQ